MITAVVTNYNKPPHIVKRCVDSIVRHGVAVILVDDNSDDRDYLSSLSASIVPLPKNIGQYRAFRIGLEMVDTTYVMRVDSDDYILGIPDISSDADAYINNIDNKVSLDVEVFLSRPYAGLNGAVIKTEIAKDIWFTELKRYGDIVNFALLTSRYECVMNEKCLYVYDRQYSTVTKAKRSNRLEDIRTAVRTARELIRSKNG